MLPILYRDQDLVAIHKPAGLLVHRTNLDRQANRFAVQMLRDQVGRQVWPIHRLDRGTSGILLFAFSPPMARALSEQFARGFVDKRYLAVVRGHPPESGTIDHPLSRQTDPNEPNAHMVAGREQPAVTTYRRLAITEIPVQVDRYPSSRYALLEANPQTGRRHQIRRHLKHISHPIVGDATYGKGRHNRLFTVMFGCARLLLACTGLAFDHPANGQRISLLTEPADDFAGLLRRFGWDTAL